MLPWTEESSLVPQLTPSSYLILLSRQGKVVRLTDTPKLPKLAANPLAETCQVVHNTVTEGEGKDN
jgi:hypothetical protein